MEVQNLSGSYSANVSVLIPPAANTSSVDTPLQRAWLSLSIIVAVLGFLGTSLVLLTYALDHGLAKNLFHVYVKNLLAADWVYWVLYSPLAILSGEVPGSFPSSVCSLYDYACYVAGDLPAIAHAIISVNRLWAMAFPQSYRDKHTKKIALGYCIGGVIFMHVVGLPLVAVENLRHGDSRTGDCALDYTDSYVNGTLLLINVVICASEAVVVGLYPYLWWKRRVRRLTKPGRSSVMPVSKSDKHGSREASTQHQPDHQRERMAASHAFSALSALTLSVALLWTPCLAYVDILTYADVTYDADLLAWLSLLYNIQTLCDPLIFLFALKDLRASFVKLIRFKQ